MKITDFVQSFKDKRVMDTRNDPNAVSEYIKNVLEVKEYIPFVEKQSIAQIVLTSCAHLSEGVVTLDSVQKYMIFTITVLSTYTNLEFEGNKTDLDAYDVLCSCPVGDSTLLDAIIKTFNKEYVRCNEILNMMTVDLMAENNMEKQIGKFLSAITDKLDSLGGSFIDSLNGLGEDLNKLDINKVTDILSKIK